MEVVMNNQMIVNKTEALSARRALLEKEKAFTRQRDELARARRTLPWVKVEKDYVFETSTGPKSLTELFAGRSQLIVQHFMFAPEWTEGCVGCSLTADHVDGALPHVQARDASFVAVSRAPLEVLQQFKNRMGWKFDWVSSAASDFNYDFDVSFRKEDISTRRSLYNYRALDFEIEDLSGFSVFLKDEEGTIFHTYSTFARGDEMLCTAYMYIDLLPKGRDEDSLGDDPTSWWRYHDQYGASVRASCCC
jgi:predicted dithiol-disulfide oxidoreductase (DUF899 family)